jgi:hypothetical protein
MIKLKKVGLTALATTMAFSAAQAGEMSVGGSMLATYTSRDGSESTGNPYGMKTNITFSASAEMDNGHTVSFFTTGNDAMAGKSSAKLTYDMGDAGSISLDQGSGSGLSNIKDVTPKVWEESWDNLDTTTSGLVGNGNSGALQYVNNFGGVKVDASYLAAGGAANSDGGTGLGHTSSGWDFALTKVMSDNLTMYAGYGQIGNANVASSEDTEYTVAGVYTMGAATLGLQMSRMDEGTTSGTDEDTMLYGVAYNINDNLAVSYQVKDTEFDKTGSADVDEKTAGLGVSYTMGSMTLAVQNNKGDNMAGVDGTNDENTEVIVSFAF